MKHHRNNCKQSFIISAMGKTYEDNFDQNGPSYERVKKRPSILQFVTDLSQSRTVISRVPKRDIFPRKIYIPGFS